MKYSFGPVSSIEAETFGEPGRRTFRLAAESGLARSYIWLEKEQLFQLGMHLQEAIRTLSEDDRLKDSSPDEPSWGGGEESVEFKAQRMLLKYDVAANSFNLQCFEGDDSEGATPKERGTRLACGFHPPRPTVFTGKPCAFAPPGGRRASCADCPSTPTGTSALGPTAMP